MSSSMMPSQSPEEHLDRASNTNTPMDKEKKVHTQTPVCDGRARVGHTGPLRREQRFQQHPCTPEGMSACAGGWTETSC